MDNYTIDMAGPWRHYQREILRDWIILGTIRCESDHSTGALARSAIGVYVQLNAGAAHSLDQPAVLAALRRATQGGGVHHARQRRQGTASLRPSRRTRSYGRLIK